MNVFYRSLLRIACHHGKRTFLTSTAILNRIKTNPTSITIMEAGKKAAAIKAVDTYIEDNQIVGVGSGSTIVYAVQRLAERVKSENLQLKCVPTSFQARQLILENQLCLSDLEQTPELDVAIDGADEVDKDGHVIKGGGGCLTQEKIVASSARKFIIIADASKNSVKLGDSWKKGVPVEVIPMAHKVVALRLQRLGLKPLLRMAKSKAGPLVTDNGNFIIDFEFNESEINDWNSLNDKITSIPGVVETGLFIGMHECVIFGQSDGSVKLEHGYLKMTGTV